MGIGRENKGGRIAGTTEFVCLTKEIGHFWCFLNSNTSLFEITKKEEERGRGRGREREGEGRGGKRKEGKGKIERE